MPWLPRGDGPQRAQDSPARLRERNTLACFKARETPTWRPGPVTRFEDATLLVGLGAPRTGTRWLSSYFTGHPQVLMSPIRVLHFFDACLHPAQYGHHNTWFREYLKEVEEKCAAIEKSGAKPPPSLEALRLRVRMIEDQSAYLEYFRTFWRGERVFCDITPGYSALERQAFSDMTRAHRRVKFLFTLRNPIDRLWS